MLNNFDRFPMSVFYNKRNTVPARELSRTMRGYWVNFATTGDPNGPGLPEWPLQVFDRDTRTEEAGLSERCAFWADNPPRGMPDMR